MQQQEDDARSRSPLQRRSCSGPRHEESNPEPEPAKVPTRVDNQSTGFMRGFVSLSTPANQAAISNRFAWSTRASTHSSSRTDHPAIATDRNAR